MDLKTFTYCKRYQKNSLIGVEAAPVKLTGEESAALPEAACRVTLCSKRSGNTIAANAVFTFGKVLSSPAAVGLMLELPEWDVENYVFFPGAVYNGNRFVSRKLPYPPYASIPRAEALTAPAVITDIPRLSCENTASRIQLRAGDMSTPACGYYDFKQKQGVLLLGRHKAGEDYTGFAFREEPAQRRAWIEYSAPGVREEEKYFFGERKDGSGWYPDMHAASDDSGRCFAAGESVELECRIHSFPAETLSDFFKYFDTVREELENGAAPDVVPFEKVYRAVKAKFQRENYIESEGYYAVGVRRDSPMNCWQAGWVGGGMNNYPFLLEDTGDAYQRALSTFRFILDKLQLESGWISGMYADGVHYGDTFDLSRPGSALLVRKNADLLYFLMKQWMALSGREADIQRYETNLRALCGAFVRLYRRYGQIGQFVDTDTGEMCIGNTASAGIAPAGLALAWECFGEPDYLETACALGELYYRDYAAKGVLNGGPGEICQAPDSESAFGTLEGFVQLYETTGEGRWLRYAEDTAAVALSWVMSYDFRFPAESAAAKREAHTLGTVFANAQNKHSAPGICTLSGNSLLKLYRFTGNRRYLAWLRRISHSLTQFASLRERAVPTLEGVYLPEGYYNERVQTSDWEGKETIGGFLNGSNWPEVSMLLTFVEVPGVYVDFRFGTVEVFDHICCENAVFTENDVLLELWNDSAFDATVMLLADDSGERKRMRHNYFTNMVSVTLEAGERKTVRLPRKE